MRFFCIPLIDYPKPMSDSYLVLMSDELPPTRDLASALFIAESASDGILNNPYYVLDGIKIMKVHFQTSFQSESQQNNVFTI